MPFNQNTAAGTVVYTPGQLDARLLLPNDQEVASSTTLVSVPELKIPLGKYERVVFRFNIHISCHANGDAKWRVDIPGSPTLYSEATTGVNTDGSEFDAHVTAATTVDTGDLSGTGGFIRIDGVVDNGANAGHIDFQFAQRASDANATKILRGSYVEFQRF